MGRKPTANDDEGFSNFFDSSFAEMGGGSNALVLESKKVRQAKELARKQASGEPTEEQTLSKTQKKRMAKLEEQREKKRQRAAAYETLQKNAISTDHVQLLHQVIRLSAQSLSSVPLS
jgi:hypothetical protein